MAYKNDLQLAFSGKEIATQRIAIIDSTSFDDETSKQFSKRRREKCQKMLHRSEERIAEIKSRIAEDISAKKLELENYNNEVTQVNTQYKLGELSPEEREKRVNTIRKKYDKVRDGAVELQQLSRASTSSEVGGQIPIDIDKEVDEFGNIIKKAGLNLPTNIPFDISVPDDVLSKVNYNDISTQVQGLSRGNILSLLGAIGGIIAIFLPWLGIGFAALKKDVFSLHALSGLINDVVQLAKLANTFDAGIPSEYLLIGSILSHCWLVLLVLLLVCCYFSIQGRGALTHVGVGSLQFVILIGLYWMFFQTLQSWKEEFPELGALIASGYHIEYGFFIAFLFAILLFYGGMCELKE